MGYKPERVTMNGHSSYPRAIRTRLGQSVRHRTSTYLNNRLEQDHRGIKSRIRGMRGSKSHDAAGRFCREHGESRDLLRPPTPSQPDGPCLPPPLPLRKRHPSCNRDHTERVSQLAPIKNSRSSATTDDETLSNRLGAPASTPFASVEDRSTHAAGRPDRLARCSRRL